MRKPAYKIKEKITGGNREQVEDVRREITEGAMAEEKNISTRIKRRITIKPNVVQITDDVILMQIAIRRRVERESESAVRKRIMTKT